MGLLTASALKRHRVHQSVLPLADSQCLPLRELSSGERRHLGHISRQGNTYVRTLLIHGSRAALLAAQRCQANRRLPRFE